MSQSLAADLLRELQDQPAPRAVSDVAHRPARPPATGEPIRVPAAAEGDRATLLDTLMRRTSTRFYASSPIAAGRVADIVDSGLRADADLWADPGRETFEATVLAFRVDGLDPGIYRLDTLDRSFELIAALPSAGELFNLTLQQEFCTSAAIISLGGNLQEHAEVRGAHGYRRLTGRAGAAAYTMWLEAVAYGLVGSVFAGLIPASIRRPLHSDGAVRHQLFALAIGAPVTAPAAPTPVQRQKAVG